MKTARLQDIDDISGDEALAVARGLLTRKGVISLPGFGDLAPRFCERYSAALGGRRIDWIIEHLRTLPAYRAAEQQARIEHETNAKRAREWRQKLRLVPPSPRVSGEIVAKPTAAESFAIEPAARFADREVRAREWVIGDLIPRGEVTLITGAGGLGKSTLLLQLGVGVAASGEFLGFDCQHGPTMLILCEDDEDEVHRRLAAITRECGIGLDALADLFVVSRVAAESSLWRADRFGAGGTTALFDEIAAAVASIGPALVVLDGVSDVFASNENDRGEVGRFMAAMTALAKTQSAPAVCLIGHPSRAGQRDGDGFSGSTAWHNKARQRLLLERAGEDDPDSRLLRVMKSNYSRSDVEIALRWERGRFVRKDASSGIERLSTAARAMRVLVEGVRRMAEQGRAPSASPQSGNFAPAVISRSPGSDGLSRRELAAAMEGALASGHLVIKTVGPPSKSREILAVPEAPSRP